MGKKRKLQSGDEERGERKHSKLSCADRSDRREREGFGEGGERVEELEAKHPWRNLQLILSLQNKDISLQKKVKLAFNYVKMSEEDGDDAESSETVSKSRVIAFLNNWVQSLLISSEKKIRAENYKPPDEIIGSVLDFRCWNILKYCLDESSKLNISLSFSKDFLRVVQCIAKSISSRLNDASQKLNEIILLVSHCVSSIFSSHGGVLNENLDLWILTGNAVLELIQIILDQNMENSEGGSLGVKLTCVVLEPFAKFLRIHPNKKNGFRDFVDKLLTPILLLLDALHTRGHDGDPDLLHNLVNFIEEVLSHGLFHPSHMEGLLSLQSTRKYITVENGTNIDSNISVQSYHRHLFDKVATICKGNNVVALNGLGHMFRLFTHCVKTQKGMSVDVLKSSSENNKVSAENNDNLNEGTRKSVFDFFIQIMEPLLQELNQYLEIGLESRPSLVDFQNILSSANKVIATFSNEKLYLRTEDISEGAFFNFLKLLYDTMISLSAKVIQVWIPTNDLGKTEEIEELNLIATELLSALGYLVEIEYEVIKDDLESLWFVIFSFGALGISLPDAENKKSVISQILNLGCQLVNLYSELRQVNTVLFTMCKVARSLLLPEGLTLPINSKFNSGEVVLNCKACVESFCMVLCSQDARLAIYNAVISIPEGQVSGFIRQLKIDISESLEWIKNNMPSSTKNNISNPSETQEELFGRGLCDIYTIVIDSLTVTAGNSNLIKGSIEEMMEVLGIKMKKLVDVKQDSVTEFLLVVTGTTQRECDFEYSQWIILFFFRMYMSCRSLYRQAMSLVPIDTSEKMSAEMGDSLTSYSGKDWLERTDLDIGSYFSWIMDSPSSLLTVVQSISDIYFVNDGDTFCSPLIYVLNAMAIQRLVDLNRLIKSFEYLLQKNKNLVQNKLSDDIVSSSIKKTLKRLKKGLSSLIQEAADLTNFVMGHLSSVSKKLISLSSSDDAFSENLDFHPLPGCDTWQFKFSAINDKSLPLAFWWMICQNIDIWCLHASKKKLNLFLSLLIENIILCKNTSTDDFALLGPAKDRQLAHSISLELLNDTVFYEQKFLRRHIASSFCRILEKSVMEIFSNISEVCLKTSPDWTEFLAFLDKSFKNCEENVYTDGSTSVAKSISHSSKERSKKCSNEQKSSIIHNRRILDCVALLDFLRRITKGYLSSKTFSVYATCIINIERLVLGSILDCQDSAYCKDFNMLLRLLLSCRRALKCLIINYCEEKMELSQSSLAMIFFQSSSPVQWLLQSLSSVAIAQNAYSDDSDSQTKNIIFSLMDHTSYIFLTLNKYQLIHEGNTLINSNSPSGSAIDIEGLNSIVLAAETLKEQMNSILFKTKAQRDGLAIIELNNLSAVLSSSQGFWHGFSAALDLLDSEEFNIKKALSRSKHENAAKLRCCVEDFAEFVDYYVRALFIEENIRDDQTRSLSEKSEDLLNDSGDVTEREQQNCGTLRNCSTSSDNKDQTEKRVKKKMLQSQNTDFRIFFFSKCDSFNVSHLRKTFLQGLVRGENPEAAFFLRQLFFAASVLLRLNLQIYSAPLSLSLVPIFIGISEILLIEMGNKADLSSPVTLVWLDGVAKFLEELASHLPLTDPTFSRNIYVKLVELHFISIGKCITLQGKSANLASHDTESSTKTLDQKMELSESTISYGNYCLNEFKTRLRRSFQAFLKKPTEVHLEAAIEGLQNALVGLQVGSKTQYDLCIESSDGGRVSSVVAAGIDCMDLILECVTGRKHLTIVKTHIHGLVACLFNIILHIQGPSIFILNIKTDKGSANPDSGSIILMCVEVLIRVSGKHAIYYMNTVQVAQSLRIPGALFQNIFQLRCSKSVETPNYHGLLENQDAKNIECANFCDVDQRFSIYLYAACCRLLGTVIKHYKSEAERCVALLEASVSTLLHCLEMVNTDAVIEKHSFAWELDEAVKCATFLRRIYEELRQQKDVFGRHCSLFLSSYIWTYSGYGPLKIGIERKVDEALRPGVYALIDACSPDDLQRLHTVFGEGPCRSTLANLQHDYKLKFQYEGKV